MKLLGIAVEDAGVEIPKAEKEKGTPEPYVDPDIADGKRYPSLHLSDKEAPTIKSKDFKDECIIVALVKVARRSEESETTIKDGKEEKEDRVSVRLQIKKLGFVPYQKGKKPGNMSDKELSDALEGKTSYAASEAEEGE